jgi:hypothetical protein
MNADARENLPKDLMRGRRRFQAWRERRRPGERIPRSLWALAVRLANVHGISRTAMALRVDYYSLKKQAEEVADPPVLNSPAFVELPSPMAVGKQCLFELDNGAGGIMRVQLVGYDTADVAALACNFWSAE